MTRVPYGMSMREECVPVLLAMGAQACDLALLGKSMATLRPCEFESLLASAHVQRRWALLACAQ